MKTRAYLIAALLIVLIALASACSPEPKTPSTNTLPDRVLYTGSTLWFAVFTDSTTGMTCFVIDTQHGAGVDCHKLPTPNAERAP